MPAGIRTCKLLTLVTSLELRVFLAEGSDVSTWRIEDAYHCQRTRYLP